VEAVVQRITVIAHTQGDGGVPPISQRFSQMVHPVTGRDVPEVKRINAFKTSYVVLILLRIRPPLVVREMPQYEQLHLLGSTMPSDRCGSSSTCPQWQVAVCFSLT
jgi:hypothetical protein